MPKEARKLLGSTEDVGTSDLFRCVPRPQTEQWFFSVSLSVTSTLCDSMDCSPPGSSCLWDSPGRNTGVGCYSLLQGICPIQGSKLGLLHCRQSLYCLSHQGRFNFSAESDTPSEHSQGPDHFWDAHRESGSANSDNLNANQTSHTASCAGNTPP